MDVPLTDVDHNVHLAYIIGVALGDGNLSRPNKRVTRLRITCDSRYTKIADEIIASLKVLFPKNKVSVVPSPKLSYFNISVYTNYLDECLPWKVGQGSKFMQAAHVPTWIFTNKIFIRACLKGLLQTDGSVYQDRGYTMVNFSNNIPVLAENVQVMMRCLGYHPRLSVTEQRSGRPKYTVRLAKNVKSFLHELALRKH
jgi:DNA-binding transcriptional regulator WhiA